MSEVAYFGVKVKLGEKYEVTVRFHGPLDTFLINTQQIKNRTRELARSYQTSNIPTICNRLASDLRDEYCNGRDLLWVEVILDSTNDLTYGTSAEKLSPDKVSV